MNKWHRMYAASLLLWGFSAGFPVFLFLALRPAGGDGWSTRPGIQFLALPFDLIAHHEPLSGWEAFPANRSAELTDKMPFPENAPLDTGPPVSPEAFPIQLYGHLNEGPREMFCFLDTRTSRWFWIAKGGIDPEAQVALVASRDAEQTLLLDMPTGDHYRLQAGVRELERLEKPSQGEAR